MLRLAGAAESSLAARPRTHTQRQLLEPVFLADLEQRVASLAQARDSMVVNTQARLTDLARRIDALARSHEQANTETKAVLQQFAALELCLAQTIREGRVTRATLVSQVWGLGWRLTAWLGLILAIVVFAGFPAMLVLGVAAVFSTNLASFFTGLAWLVVMWVAVYMFFVVQSVSLGQAGVFRSMWNSVNVVRWNLGSALGLVVVINLMQRGLPMIWDMFATDAWALPVSIVGNAYIGTGLMAASMIFYGQRFALWQAVVRGRAAQTPSLEAKGDKAGGSVQ